MRVVSGYEEVFFFLVKYEALYWLKEGKAGEAPLEEELEWQLKEPNYCLICLSNSLLLLDSLLQIGIAANHNIIMPNATNITQEVSYRQDFCKC